MPMTVKELIAKLQTFDQDLVVNVGSYDVEPVVFVETFEVQPGFEGEGTTQLSISNRHPESL